MKHTYRLFSVTGLLMVLLLILPACDSFLDEVPDNRVDLDDLDKAAQLLTNAYSIASPAFTEWMTDNVGYTRGVTIRQSQQQIYDWEDVTADPTEQDTPDFFWYQTYEAIAHSNEVLAVINDLPVNSEQDRLRKDAIKAEALLTRAYGHFMLVNIFAEHVTIDDDEPGIPYVKEPETSFIQTYKRASIKKVYNEIEDDLLDGLDLVNDNFFSNSGKYHFTQNAALAFASRFYLYQRDFTRCLQYSNELLGASPEAFVRDMTSEEFQVAKSSIQGYPQLYSSPDLPSNIMLMRKISLVQRPDFAHGPLEDFYGQLFGTSPFEGATDERENPAFVKGDNGLLPLRYENLFERSSLNSNVGLPYHIALAFRGEEVLLNRAEANAFLGNANASLADVQILMDRRYSGPDTQLTFDLLRDFYGSNLSEPDLLLNYILFERRKEFILQGLRWFDIKRYEIGVTHTQIDGPPTVLEDDDLRKIIQIPQSAIDVGGLEPNER